MNVKIKIYFAFGFLLTLWLFFILFPSGIKEKAVVITEQEAPFLSVDPSWADSVLLQMTTEEKLSQLFIPEVNAGEIGDSISGKKLKAGGISYTGNDPQKETSVNHKLAEENGLPLLISSENPFSPFVNSTGLTDEVVFRLGDTTFRQQFIFELLERNRQYGFNFLQGFDAFDPVTTESYLNSEEVILPLIRRANEQRLLFAGGKIKRTYDTQLDSLLDLHEVLSSLKHFTDNGLTVLLIDTAYFSWKSLNRNYPALKDFAENELGFKGLITTRFPEYTDTKNTLQFVLFEGVDIILTGKHHYEIFGAAKKMLEQNIISETELNKKVRKILLAKSWIRSGNYPTTERLEAMQYTEDPYAKTIIHQLTAAGSILLVDKKNTLPFINTNDLKLTVFEIGRKSKSFTRELNEYYNIGQFIQYDDCAALAKQDNNKIKTSQSLVFCLYNEPQDSSEVNAVKKVMRKFPAGKRVMITSYKQAEIFDHETDALLLMVNENDLTRKIAAQQIAGAEKISGKSPLTTQVFALGKGKFLSASRLRYGIAEEAGIDQDSLNKIDYIMEEGIRNKAFPGGQVLLAVDGKIIFHRTYGYHSYDKKTAVQKEDYYDMASVTKVMATTLMAMHLYEKKKFALDDSLQKFLPDTLRKYLPRESSIRNITFRQLLVHASGLPAGQNIIRFLRFGEDYGRYDLYYCDEKCQQFDIALADSFYIDNGCLDTLWLDLNKIYVDPGKKYCYSDANMNLLYTMLRPMTGKIKWDRYLDSVFYEPLGMKHTTFVPLQKGIEKEKITPTENDRYWRKNLLQGYVHDPTAALYGGVAGNAGLFSNAYDMAVLCQLFLNKGVYGGKRYFESSTIELFTAKQPGTHRGLGFNGQISGNTYGCSPYASEKTYGHTGFTGTAFWIDPELKFVYVFITNRVHPDPENKKIIQLGTTKRVHNVIYELLIHKEEKENPLL